MRAKNLMFLPLLLLLGFTDTAEKVAGAPVKFNCSAIGDRVSEVDFTWPSAADRFHVRMKALSFTHDDEWLSLGTIFIRRPDKDNFIAIRMSPPTDDQKKATIFFQANDGNNVHIEPFASVSVTESVLIRVHQESDGTLWLNLQDKTIQFPPNLGKNASIRLACASSDIVFEEMEFFRSSRFEDQAEE